MNLSSTRHKPLLSHRYYGKAIYVSEVLYKPIRITAFEIVKSPKTKARCYWWLRWSGATEEECGRHR